MTTTKSFSKPKTRLLSLYKVSLKNLLPAMVIFGIIFFLAIPFVYVLLFINNGVNYNDFSDFANGIYLAGEEHSIVVYVFVAVMAFMLALFTNSYMHGKKNVDVYHAIPATRKELLSSNLLASLTTIIVPLLGNYILAIIIESLVFVGRPLITPLYHWHNIQDIICVLLYAAVIYLFTSFISVHVGTVFDTFAISLALGFSVMIVYTISGYIWANITYGASFDPGIGILMLSPFTFIFYKYKFLNYDGYISWPDFGWFMLFILCVAAVTVGLFYLTAACYKKRKSELAEQAMTNGVFQTCVKILASFLGAALMYAMFAESSVGGQVFAALIGAVLVGTIAELIFSRGIKSFIKNLRWIAGTGLVCCLLILTVNYDLTGYENRIPSDDTIASVTINHSGRFSQLTTGSGYYSSYSPVTLTNPESIAVVTETHRQIVDNKLPNNNYGYNGNYDYAFYPYTGIYFEYKLKSGATVIRRYNRAYYEAITALTAIEDKDDYITQSSPIFVFDSDGMRDRARPVSITYSDSLRSFSQSFTLNETDTRRLIDALKADMLNETLAEIYNPTQSALGYITIQYRLGDDEAMYSDWETRGYYSEITSASVLITYEYVNTIALLKESGAYDIMTNTPAPDSVYILPSRSYSEDNIVVLSPENVDGDMYNNVYRYTASRDANTSVITMSDDPAEVQRILASSTNQMLVNDRYSYPERSSSEDEFYESSYYSVIFCKDNTVIGLKMIRYTDLSESMQQAVREFRDTEYYTENYWK